MYIFNLVAMTTFSYQKEYDPFSFFFFSSRSARRSANFFPILRLIVFNASFLR